MVPPRGRMPLTSFSCSSRDFSGQMSPSKPSWMPMTFHLCFRTADFTAARITAFSPGQSPPPVVIAIVLTLVMPHRENAIVANRNFDTDEQRHADGTLRL